MNYKLNWALAEGAFALPDFAADNCLKLASGKAVKVLIYIARNKTIALSDAEKIAAELDTHMSAEDVEDALSYWEQVGVICRSDAAVSVASNVKQETFTLSSDTAASQQSKSDTPKVSAAKAREQSMKMLSPQEIAERVQQSDEISFLFTGAENILGKVLTYTEQRSLIWFHDYYGIGCDILIMIIEYCKSINKAGIGYIDKMVQSWAEKEISTHEQAEAEIRRLQSLHTLEGQVVSKLGLNRGLTKKEREYIETWANNGITIELVEYAYEKTVNATGKASFGYMNTIIMDWVKNNLYTIPEIDSYNERYSKSKYKQKKNDPSAKPPAESDSSEHSYDLNKLLEHAMNNIPTIKEN